MRNALLIPFKGGVKCYAQRSVKTMDNNFIINIKEKGFHVEKGFYEREYIQKINDIASKILRFEQKLNYIGLGNRSKRNGITFTANLMFKNQIFSDLMLNSGLLNVPNVAVLSDEIYGRLVFEKKEFPTFLNYPDLYDRLIILDGWSKTYAMTGWRLGWGVWPEKLVNHLFKFCVNNHSCVNAAIQYGAIAALDGPDDSIYAMVKKFISRKNLIVGGLRKIQGIEFSEPKSGFFIFPNIKGTGMNGDEFTEKCLNKVGVALIQGTAFGKFATNNVRLNFTTSEENINNALEKITKMLN